MHTSSRDSATKPVLTRCLALPPATRSRPSWTHTGFSSAAPILRRGSGASRAESRWCISRTWPSFRAIPWTPRLERATWTGSRSSAHAGTLRQGGSWWSKTHPDAIRWRAWRSATQTWRSSPRIWVGEADDAQTLAGPDGCAGDGICAWHHDLRSGGRRAGGRPDPRSVRRERRQPDRHRRRLSACGSERHVGGDHRPLAQAESGQARHDRPGDQVPRPDGRLRQLRGSISALDHPRVRDEPPPAADRLHRPVSSAPVGPCHSDRRDPRRVRHPRALRESSLHRGLEFHRLAARTDRADRPAYGVSAPVSLQPQYNMLAREIEWEIVPVCVEEGL